MYEVFYNLKAEPFRLSPDHKFCYEHKGYAKARAYMAYAFKRAEGFVMITGRPGTGKTTLIGELVESLANDNVRTANLVCTQLQADDLLKTVAFNFGIGQGDFDKAQLLQRLTTLFHRWHQEGGRALLIVDEAQDLSASAMEELRLLTNIQVGGQPLVQIFLLGQPELRDLVMAPEMEQVHQRVIAASHLRGLEVDETEAYVAHRLHAVGWKGDPAIDRAIFPLIHKFSEGVPRRINLICSRLFLLCSVEQRHEVVVADVKDVIGELQAENLAAGSWFSEADFDLTAEPEWLAVPGQPAPQGPDDDGGPAGGGSTPETEESSSGEESAEPESNHAETQQGSGHEASAASEREEIEAEAGAAEPDGELEASDAVADEPVEAAAETVAVEAVEEAVEEEAVSTSLGAGEGGLPESDAVMASEPEVLATEMPEPEIEASAADQGQVTVAGDEPEGFEGPDASVEVIEELFEVVTSGEHVDLPGEGASSGAGEGSGDGPRYFTGTVVAESALGSEEAVSELANMPDEYIDDSHAHPVAASAQEGNEAPLHKLDELQRDGKAWPTSSRPAPVAKGPSPRTSRAIAVLALVAMVGAGVFFLELYLSQQDQGGGSLLDRLSRDSAPTADAQADLASSPVDTPVAAATPEPVVAASPIDVEDPDTGVLGAPDATLSPDSEPVDDRAAAAAETATSEMTDVQEAPAALDETAATSAEATAGGEAALEGSSGTSPAVPVVKQVYVVNFDFDSSDIGQDANAVLGRALEKLQQYPASTATIARNARGQTPGTAAATMSEARAGAVAQYFLDEGVEPTRISIESVTGQELAAAISGRDSSRAVQVIVSRLLDS